MSCVPVAADASNLARAAAILRTGGLVALPTETVYGLGANALNAQAVARIFEAKGRPFFDPLIVHAPSLEAVQQLVQSIPPAALELARRCWPGPVTLVLPKRDIVPDIVTAGLPSVAVRVPAHPVALELLRLAGVPVAAPSANRFGAISPTLAEHVASDLGSSVDMILDGGPCESGVESTVISFLEPSVPTLLRPGALPVETIEAIVGKVRKRAHSTSRPGVAAASPGMLEKHYAPRTPMSLLSAPADAHLAAELPASQRVGLLCLKRPADVSRYAAVEELSPAGDLRQAAARLFAAMRALDTAGLDVIVAEPVPEHGLGLAINDRLRRAACRDE